MSKTMMTSKMMLMTSKLIPMVIGRQAIMFSGLGAESQIFLQAEKIAIIPGSRNSFEHNRGTKNITSLALAVSQYTDNSTNSTHNHHVEVGPQAQERGS